MESVKISGTTKPYKGNGRKLGYPTANIAAPTALKDGVYFGHANLGSLRHKPALIFIGIPTTVGDHTRRVEAHLLDIKDIDYYDKTLTITVEHFYRPNETFDTVDALLMQMHKDEADARLWFESA